jgi:hypothetical protein
VALSQLLGQQLPLEHMDDPFLPELLLDLLQVLQLLGEAGAEVKLDLWNL